MKKTLPFLLCLFFSLAAFGQAAADGIALIPQPVSVEKEAGSFTLPAKSVVLYGGDQPEIAGIASMLCSHLSTATGYSVSPKAGGSGSGGTIQLLLLPQEDKLLGQEGYRLAVGKKRVTISANRPAGLFYGVQTLRQLFPPAIESKDKVLQRSWTIPAVRITDYPRFAWRGLMFDVVRHFFTKEQVKQFIDEMVKYKYNLLHLHLTDDEGWRLEIKALPRLTEVGAWNVKKVGRFGYFSPPAPDEPRNYGGFFTHQDIRELVQYARERYVDILPEIETPGHSLAAIASYPELSCTPGAEKYRVRSGEEIMVWPESGHFYGLVDNTLCPANDKVYPFLDKVFTEVAQLFPFPYIHMGGDETARNFWETSPAIRELMQKEKLKDLNEVQSYFVKRVEKIIESKGKKLIGWDEILEGGLAPNAAVMSWRGVKGGIEAARMGHEVVMSPTTYVYLDYMQSDSAIEPPVYATLRLKKSYEFDPVPEGVDPKWIKGGQANLWTEQVYNMRHLQYMVWPRAFAVAECVWSPKESRNWGDFVRRVEKHFERNDAARIKYAPSLYDPTIRASRDASGQLLVDMENEVDGLTLHYSFDYSFPDPFYPEYTASIPVPKDASVMRIISCRNGKPIGRMITIPVTELQKRADRGKK